jgi:AAA ATPase domain
VRLIQVQIQDFRCIEDSGEFAVDPVTCLVGKNESGKTAVLKALHKLKADAGKKESFIPSRDYPKRKWRPDTPISGNVNAIQTTWDLSATDVRALEEKFGEGVISDRQITLAKGYDNGPRIGVSIDESRMLRHFLPETKLSAEEMEPISHCKTVDELIAGLRTISPMSQGQERLLNDLSTKFPNGADEAVMGAVWDSVPTFLYFDQYLKLPGTVSVNDIAIKKQQNRLTEHDEVFLALLSLAGTTIEGVNNAGTYEEFNSSLRAVSNQITDIIFKYWSQNKHLDVEIRLDSARPADAPPFNSGYIFRTRIDNRRHRADTSFDDRSSGFVWFFSFLIWFNELKKQHGQNLVILLDEPGLTLHARAQSDLLRYIKEELRPQYQVIYTTHSPFMIDPDNLLSARTVEDVVQKDKVTGEEILLGTKVCQDVLSTDADTVSPLQKALDYQLTQTLFVGKNTLLVEGPSDLAYLKWFSRQLQAAHRTSLDYRWSICIGGGVTRIPGFVSLFRGNGLNVAAIVDVQAGDKNKIENARKALPDNHLITLDTYAAQNEADIEDVLGREFYVALVKNALDLRAPHDLPRSGTTSSVRVAKEVDQHAATLPAQYPAFNHYLPAEWLFMHEEEGKQLPGFDSAMDRMESIIVAINKLI